MGQGESTANDIPDNQRTGPAITLNVYVSGEGNFQVPGFGVYHSGLEISGVEYTFAGSPEATGSGVFAQTPKETPPGSQWVYNQSVDLGKTNLSSKQVSDVIYQIKQEFPANKYDVVGRNCNHFTELLCSRLNVTFPGWVNRAAKMGSMLQGKSSPMQEEELKKMQEKKRQHDLKVRREEKALEREKMEAKQAELKPEPAKDAVGVVTIQINLPNGTKTSRRFLNTHKVADVAAFTRAFDLSLSKTKFFLRSNHPVVYYKDPNATLKSAGMGKRENLFVHTQ